MCAVFGSGVSVKPKIDGNSDSITKILNERSVYIYLLEIRVL